MAEKRDWLELTCQHGPYDGAALVVAPWKREVLVKMSAASPTTYLYRVAQDDTGARYLAFAGAVEGVAA
jgi:hypothetical protein